MANFLEDNEDLKFYLEKYIDWEPLVRLVEYDFKMNDGFESNEEATEFYNDVLNMVGELVANEIAPRAKAIEENPVKMVDGEVVGSPEFNAIFDQINEVGLHGLCLPRELGGMNAPLLVYMLAGEMFSRADVSVMTHHSLHGGMALAMLLFSVMEGSTEIDLETMTMKTTRFQKEIEEIITGQTWGAMDITEPDAGSDMAALRTKAEQDEDGNWFVTGEKTFITSGHGKYHFVIARSEETKDSDDPFAGLAGLSFFLVPLWEDTPEGRKHYGRVDRLEDKIGHKNSATCAMVFDHAPAQLIGKRGEGFRYMLFLMNNARVGVGFESLGVCENSLRLAKNYAAERRSMGKTIDKHEMIAEYLEDMDTDTRSLRALGVHAAYHSEMAQRSQIALLAKAYHNDTEKSRYELLYKRHLKEARRVTPLLKYYGSERAVYMARMCMQIHGGVGYTKEYQAEQLLRDALVLPIYEGTSQIQSLMATKDVLLNILKNPKDLVQGIAQAKWRTLSARDPLDKKVAKLQALCLGAQQTLLTRMAAKKFRSLSNHKVVDWASKFFKEWDAKKDFSPALLHAERLTLLLTDAAISELLLEQATRFPERRELLERFLEKAIPRAEYNSSLIATTGDRLLDTLDDTPAQLGEKQVG
ncbi:MAG: hypothetical protein HOI23_09040 [Deltaproteobacteria bacterium]|nr:hypothetical protein [Deltaproteobacteria bacterium]